MSSSALAIIGDMRALIGFAHVPHQRQMDAAASEAALADWLGVGIPQVRAILLSTWDRQRGVLTAAQVADALASGDLTGDILDRWRESYSAFVVFQLAPLWRQGNARASTLVSNGLGFGLPARAFAGRMDAWIDAHGGELATYLTNQQHQALKVVLQRAASEGLASGTVAEQLKPIVGLTRRQAMALESYRDALLADPDVPASSVTRLVATRAQRLHNVRAMRIARTELADAYNEASLETVRTALDEDALDEAPEKVWLTSEDERTCSICGPLHESRAALAGTFSGGHDRPTAHPGCRCTLIFEFKDQE